MSDEFTEEELHLISVCHLAGFRYVIGVLGAAAHDDSRVVAATMPFANHFPPFHLGVWLCTLPIFAGVLYLRHQTQPIARSIYFVHVHGPAPPSVPSHLSRNCLTGDYVA